MRRAGGRLPDLRDTRRGGRSGPEMLKGFNSIADLRESELRCAAGYLGLKEVFFLDYRDSGMPGSADNQNRAPWRPSRSMRWLPRWWDISVNCNRRWC